MEQHQMAAEQLEALDAAKDLATITSLLMTDSLEAHEVELAGKLVELLIPRLNHMVIRGGVVLKSLLEKYNISS